MLPENLFINLLDMELQERILNGKGIDLDIKNPIETLLEEGPTNLQNNLHDWKIEEINGRWTIKKRIMFQRIKTFDKTL
jgi:hypothetical protein